MKHTKENIIKIIVALHTLYCKVYETHHKDYERFYSLGRQDAYSEVLHLMKSKKYFDYFAKRYLGEE